MVMDFYVSAISQNHHLHSSAIKFNHMLMKDFNLRTSLQKYVSVHLHSQNPICFQNKLLSLSKILKMAFTSIHPSTHLAFQEYAFLVVLFLIDFII